MKRKLKRIKKQGNSLCIILTREDRDMYNFNEGDEIELTITKVNKK